MSHGLRGCAEWWSKRPLPGAYNNRHRRGHTQSLKQICHGIERAWERELMLDEMQMYYEEKAEEAWDNEFGCG